MPHLPDDSPLRRVFMKPLRTKPPQSDIASVFHIKKPERKSASGDLRLNN